MIEYYFLMWKVYYNLKKKFFVNFVIIVALFCHWCSKKKKAMNKIKFRESFWETGMFNAVFLCLCNNWRHWCEVGENLLFQIADVNCAFCGLPNFIGIPGIENVWIDQYYTCNMYDFNFFSSIEYSDSKHKSNYVFDKYFWCD